MCSEIEKKIFLKQFENKFNTIPMSSFGRLFDAVASIGVVRQTIIYEAAGAIEFEAFLDDNVIVFTHGKVPPIDGGLALGQAVVASCDR